MKKIVVIIIALFLICGFIIGAQESADEKPKVNYWVHGEAAWIPLVYRGDMDGIVDDTRGEGSGLGVSANPGDGGAAVSIGIWGDDADKRFGFRLHITPAAGNGIFYIRDGTAYVWSQPWEMLKMQFGLFNWNDLASKVGSDIFQPVTSGTFGALFILTPPSSVPETLKGLKLYSDFGVSGWFDPGNLQNYAARAADLAKYAFSTPQAGIGYKNDSFGLARVQFIASNYFWGEGNDGAIISAPWSWGASAKESHGWFPPRAREAAQFEAAVNITTIPKINMDIGFSYCFPVTVKRQDGIMSYEQKNPSVGPTYLELGYRTSLSWVDNFRIANTIGDVWRPPSRIAIGLNYYPDDVNLNLSFSTKLEFGEQVAFSDGSENFKGGIRLNIGAGSSYTFGKTGTLGFDGAIKIKMNDYFNGKITGFDQYNEVGILSVTHNGTIDLGVNLYFTRPVGKYSHVATGISANLPLGGDRYNWSQENLLDNEGKPVNGGEMLRAEHAEAYKKGKLTVAIPITIAMNF